MLPETLGAFPTTANRMWQGGAELAKTQVKRCVRGTVKRCSVYSEEWGFPWVSRHCVFISFSAVKLGGGCKPASAAKTK